MRILSISSIIALSAVALFSCSKEDLYTSFYLNNNQEITIVSPDTVPPNSTVPIDQATIETNINQIMADKGVDLDKLKEVSIEKLTLTILRPETRTFSFLKKVEIYIKADSLPELLLAHVDQVPQNVGKTLDVQVTNAQLKPYISKNVYKVRFNAENAEAIAANDSITFKADFKYKIVVNPAE